MMVQSLKMMSGFMQDKSITGLVDTLEVFVSSISQLMGVFSQQYEGDDFCCGLIFGSNGAQMLVNIAKTFINVRNMSTNLGGGLIKSTTRSILPKLNDEGENEEIEEPIVVKPQSKKSASEEKKKPSFRRFSSTKGDGEV